MLGKLGLAALSVYAAAMEIIAPSAPEAATAGRMRRSPIPMTVILTLVAAGLLGGLAAFLFIESGVYDLAADEPHLRPVEWTLLTLRDRSVEFHSRGIRVPDLTNAAMATGGFLLYRKNCETCHGAPGTPNEQVGRGINPKPPRLATSVDRWTDSQLYWIVSRGLKLSGMPAFEPRLSDGDRWAIVAFLRRMIWLSPADYGRMSAQLNQGVTPAGWPPNEDGGFARMKSANAQRGRELLWSYGCASCHLIPGIGRGRVGPPMETFAERQYVAGILVNVPANAVAWITNPKRFKPATVMPNLGVSERDAFDIAAYLYTFGQPRRIETLRKPGELHR